MIHDVPGEGETLQDSRVFSMEPPMKDKKPPEEVQERTEESCRREDISPSESSGDPGIALGESLLRARLREAATAYQKQTKRNILTALMDSPGSPERVEISRKGSERHKNRGGRSNRK